MQFFVLTKNLTDRKKRIKRKKSKFVPSFIVRPLKKGSFNYQIDTQSRISGRCRFRLTPALTSLSICVNEINAEIRRRICALTRYLSPLKVYYDTDTIHERR